MDYLINQNLETTMMRAQAFLIIKLIKSIMHGTVKKAKVKKKLEKILLSLQKHRLLINFAVVKLLSFKLKIILTKCARNFEKKCESFS